ncbi:MAG TPA: ECF-type sigma factor [Thermoanaerobaculia bacterium]|nr:ECF-type sigma factor [Thermoanaerobaculia bacterium]
MTDDAKPVDRLMPLVYEELRLLAAKILQGDRGAGAVAPTSLVHEAYLRLLDQRKVDWQDRSHFFRIAARVMRRVLVDTVRTRQAKKRGAGLLVTLVEAAAEPASPRVSVQELDEVLTTLTRQAPLQASIVELRYFAGFTIEETAAALGISPATVKRDWALARAWIYLQLQDKAALEQL